MADTRTYAGSMIELSRESAEAKRDAEESLRISWDLHNAMTRWKGKEDLEKRGILETSQRLLDRACMIMRPEQSKQHDEEMARHCELLGRS
jgi:hypothetical protein